MTIYFAFAENANITIKPKPCIGVIDPREYGVSVMAAFGYRAGEPKRAKTRQAAGDVVQWVE
ncbi:hypothetical protein [uncultured Neisseria sp.]|uniref:hypothetical protein n=1 Tax=uncultured Neisseria sp. TaxID=237778 RepID=UPI0025DA85F2|nr:hypothetical protein [uncultured Neisseria sp.]